MTKIEIELKNSFKKCMLFLYPDGIENPVQWKALVHTFNMGWVEALIAVKDTHALIKLIGLQEEMSEEDWWPDDSWKWW